MDPKDLLKLLDLAGVEPIPPPGESVMVPSSQEPAPCVV